MTVPIYRFLEVALYSLLNLMPFLLLAIYPFRRHLRFTRHATAWLVAGMGVVQIGLGYLTAFCGVSSEIMSLASTVIYASFYFFVVKDNLGRLAFVLLVLANLGNLVSICAKCLEGMLFGPLALENYRWSMILCMLIMHALITLPSIHFVRKYFNNSIPIHNQYWKYLWIIPATFYLIWYYHLYFAGHSSLEIAMDIKHALFLLIINLGALVVYKMAIALLLAQEENAKLTHNNYLLTLQNIQYDNLQQRIDEARHAKHDVRHHNHLIREYLRSGKLQELEAYLDEYTASLPNTQTMTYCQHEAINALLGYFAQQARADKTSMDVFIQLPAILAIPDTTLTVILGNLLENAMEASRELPKEDRKVTVRGKAEAGSVFFTISNHFNGDLHKNIAGKLVSTKSVRRGIGLDSVRHLAAAHSGMLEISTENGVFTASVLLMEDRSI